MSAKRSYHFFSFFCRSVRYKRSRHEMNSFRVFLLRKNSSRALLPVFFRRHGKAWGTSGKKIGAFATRVVQDDGFPSFRAAADKKNINRIIFCLDEALKTGVVLNYKKKLRLIWKKKKFFWNQPEVLYPWFFWVSDATQQRWLKNHPFGGFQFRKLLDLNQLRPYSW